VLGALVLVVGLLAASSPASASADDGVGGPPSQVATLVAAGRAAMAAGDARGATQRFASALALVPNDAALMNNLAAARAADGDSDAALALLRRAVALAPERADIRANLNALIAWRHRQWSPSDEGNTAPAAARDAATPRAWPGP
jgi:Flp pilus assembly protein TadD